MSDEVSQFLESVERLRGQQIEEDEVRARELEEYLAAKRERQARRAERARSISPQKSSPVNTPSPRSSRQSVRLKEGLKIESPVATPDDAREPSADPEPELQPEPETVTMGQDSSPRKESESPTPEDVEATRDGTSSTPPTRTPTLSWQKRPTSRGGSRPLSMVAAQNATQRSLAGSQEPQSATETSYSREQIAQNLGSKDPSWFRQTADRGQDSAAYRRNQVEDEERADMASARSQLPGMADASRDRTPPVTSTTGTPTQAKLASPLPLNPPRFDALPEDESVDEPIKSPTGQTSPTRSTSPTKGMGGFVQSAMMKRTDSVKRWSVQSPPGLTRADSVTSNRSAYDRSRPKSFVRGDSKTPESSRPTSQQGEKGASDDNTPMAAATGSPESKPKQSDETTSVPTSPSKTMDARRWSPTKSSWLDSALNKPDSPKPQPKPYAPAQPAWMVELNKNKTERANNPGSEHGRTGSVSHKHQVSIGGLMRSSPMGTGVKPNTTDLGGIYSPPARGNRPEFGHAPKPSLTRDTAGPAPEQAEEEKTEETEPTEPPAEPKEDGQPEEAQKPSSMTSAPPTKPKPETPPKKDFRANLKQRPADSGETKAAEPEFKNALGNLRRTKTQNYVAPDELKGNILRGKAALNVTGGPQKSERKDEFKEAILKKKDDFKKAQAEGKGITRTPATNTEKPLPEGLARRAELGKPAGLKKDPTVDTTLEVERQKPDSSKPTPAPKSQSEPFPMSSSTQESSAKSPPVDQPKPVSTEPDVSSPADEVRTLPGLQKETSAPSKLQGRSGGGKLADRFNPALASMLARGAPPMATDGGKGPGESASGGSPAGGDSNEPPAPGPQLTHMTKGRARGPRRKAPTAAAAAQKPSQSSPPQEESSPQTESVKQLAQASPTIAVKREERPPSPTDESPAENLKASGGLEADNTAPLSIQQQAAAQASLRGKSSPIKPVDNVSEAGKDMGTTRPFPLRRRPTSPEKQTAEPPSPIKPHKTGGDVSQPGSPKKLDMKRMSRFLDDSSVNSQKPDSANEPGELTHQRTGSRSPVKSERPLPEPQPSSPTKVDSEPVASVKSATSRFDGAPAKSPSPAPKPSFDSLNGTSAPSTPKSQSRMSARPLPIPINDETKSPPPVSSPMRSPTKQASELSTLLTDFFGPDRPTRDYKVDPALLLTSTPQDSGKVKTLGCQRFQISGDGKKVPIPAHHERTLFEREMYTCTHEFLDKSGKKTLHVYFWAGDEVPESAVEDAQLFAQREARSLGAKFVKTLQGRETSEFLQGLGGTVVTRRGSSNKYDSLAPNMLCGRRHLGQVVFDEVDFTPASLCAGFPYLITQSGKCYLWKGKGSHVDELSCARLIGMDLTLMGEPIEYEEGSEPASFWELFESSTKPHSADHWRRKPNYGKYCARLFCSNADSRQQIFEVSPFSQTDLSPGSIYVLDAFFEMYIVVGSRAQSQFPSFRNALNFAQEYAILAASIEDRPFVPVSTVVLEGVPRDMKHVFRKWTDERSPTVMKEKTGLKRGRSLRVVTLNQALQALSQ